MQLCGNAFVFQVNIIVLVNHKGWAVVLVGVQLSSNAFLGDFPVSKVSHEVNIQMNKDYSSTNL